MATQWEDWLQTLSAAGKRADLPDATRGLVFSEIIEIEGDWTGSVMTGGIRTAPDAASYLVEFAVDGPTISGDYTVFVISLAAGSGANSTGALSADGDLNGIEEFPWAIHLQPSGGDEELLCGGKITVQGIVG